MRRASDDLVAEIEGRIASGQFENNRPLPAERDLMEEFNMSRTVVREAISTLANRGLIESRPRYRPIVKKPDYGTVLTATGKIITHLLDEPGGVANLYKSREFVERGLVRHAALHATKDDIANLKAALNANQAAINDTPTFFETDMQFHGVLYQIMDNPIFSTIHKGYISWLAPNWGRMKRPADHNQVNYDAHRKIYEAILERDPTQAENALSEHLSVAWVLVKDTLEARQAND
ncbi:MULTISPECIES: FCD domain-containing protein [unclassified Lentilitoribacter]|jgi:DNA-binding FadR family transcriptional regulator|uniref:FCD domain-containing protein n=1 Tax=unclassified Lentilitoribacter TaxID=2647570 RepID=UPI0013A68E80|nr:FCD domain-containing protein [Lentilitoribacter sp. Alg239-R112]